MPAKTGDRLFRVAMTGDFYNADGSQRYPNAGPELFAGEPQIPCTVFKEHRAEIGPDQVAGLQGVVVLTPRVTANTVSQSHDLLAVARFGVGYDTVDVPACTAADVAVLITAGAVDRSVAEATIAWMLALTHHVRTKDRLLREGQWDARSSYMGSELRDRTLGVIGMGGIARALVGLLAGFGMRQPLAFDPYLEPQTAERLGVKLVGLDELMAEADFVSIHCPFTEKTRNLIGAKQLGMMKRGAYLLNTARGGIIDEDALYDALKQERIAGAALDCFVGEPITSTHRFAEFDNVLLAPHSIAWTNEMFRDMGLAASQNLVELAHGRRPRGTVNPEVFNRSTFQEKWDRLRLA